MKFYYSLLLFLCLCAGCWGQGTQQMRDSRESRDSGDSIEQELLPPELVMQYQQEINLSEGQSHAIREEIHKAQGKFVDMQWELQTETEKLALLLKARPAEEGAVLAQLDKVLDRERAIKKTQISLLVRIRNLLTEAQQAKLMELRRKPS